MKSSFLPFLTLLCTLPPLVQPALAQNEGAAPGQTATWQPTTAPLMTKWAKDVKPDAALPDYPRPQMVRKEWQSLNGLWQFEEARTGSTLPHERKMDGQILVPFPVESALSGVGKRASRVWYRRNLEVPAAWKGRRILLHFDAVNWESGYFLNGKLIGTHKGGYDAVVLDVTDQLKEGVNELIVGAINQVDGPQPRGKQSSWPDNDSHTASTGIWQSVWMEPVSPSYLKSITLTPDVDGGALNVKVEAANAEGDSIQVDVFDGTQKVGTAKGVASLNLPVPVPNAKLWSPENPFLYDVQVSLLHEGKTQDSVSSYTAFRKIALGADADGKPRIFLNGKQFFLIGVLDQGYWPEGIYTAPTDEALRSDIEAAKKCGFNLIRKHIKIEPSRWYYWADKLGMLVWQDMPNGRNDSTLTKKQFEDELRRLIEGRRNHPSIVVWQLFHENWGQFDTERLASLIKVLDPTRLVCNASIWADKNVGDIFATHNNPIPKVPTPDGLRALVNDEFGAQMYRVPDHTWGEKIWGNLQVTDQTVFERNYLNWMAQAWKIKELPGASGVIYRQLTDVENENFGLQTYDRAVWKISPENLAAINSGKNPLPPLQMFVAIAKDGPVVWKYTTEKPTDEWRNADFDDTAWQTGEGGFGKDMADKKEALIRTEWKTREIWLRREFEMPADLKTPILSVMHDEDFEVYINGVLAAKAKEWRDDYGEFSILPEAKATLKPGKNLIAVHCKQNGGGQYIDVGIGQF